MLDERVLGRDQSHLRFRNSDKDGVEPQLFRCLEVAWGVIEEEAFLGDSLRLACWALVVGRFEENLISTREGLAVVSHGREIYNPIEALPNLEEVEDSNGMVVIAVREYPSFGTWKCGILLYDGRD